MSHTTPIEFYRQRLAVLNQERTKTAARKNAIAWGRLAATAGGILLFFLLKESSLAVAVVAAVTCFALFLRLVAMATREARRLNNTDQLVQVNQQEMATAEGNYQHLPTGVEYLPAAHPYAYDLDIFGKASLFQYLNRTTTQQGNATLGRWLLQPATQSEIEQRQVAAKELSQQPQWQQQLQAHGMAKPITLSAQHRIEQYLAVEDDYFARPIWQVVRWVGPAVALTVLALYLADVLEYQVFFLCLFVLFLITGFISKKATPTYHTLSRIAPEVATLSALAGHIEKPVWKNNWLQQRQQVFTQNDQQASVAIRILNGILSRLDYRLNPVAFIPLNIFLFWDLQQLLAFERWKKANAVAVPRWFSSVGEMEAINSLATLHFNHPKWAFPTIVAEQGCFEATDLGHPLLPDDKVVHSSFSTRNRGQIAIITGSNMAGKSTFLRSVGLALVLGQAGAPVCTSSAAFACMQVISTMRISDNLAESTSTFYAELKKLKDIIDAVNRQENVFLLLDEILRGTNSLDRHTGSKALVEQLIRQQATGILATHDLALAELVHTHPQHIANYHFDVQVAGEELYFDYKLKNGICQSLNASVLMKKIGIEM